MNITLKEIAVFLVIVGVFTFIRVDILSSNQYCLAWDCPFYLKHIGEGTYFVEMNDPFFLYLGVTANQFFNNEIYTVKFFMLLFPIIWSIGTWVLARKYMKPEYAMIVVYLVNVLMGMTRLWFDLYKNCTLLCFLPFFFYFYLEKDSLSIYISATLLFLMSLTHLTWTFFAFVPIFYSLVMRDKEMLKKSIMIVTSAVIGHFTFWAIVGLDSPLWSLIKSLPLYTVNLALDYNKFFYERLFYGNYFSGSLIAFSFIGLFFWRRKDKLLNLMLSAYLLAMCIVLIPHWDFVGGRLLPLSTYFIAFIFVFIFYNIVENITFKIGKLDKYRNIILTLIMAMLLISISVMGFNYYYSANMSITQEELEIIDSFEEEDYIITTSRQHYWVDYLKPNNNITYVYWEEFWGEIIRTDARIVFMESPNKSYDILKNITTDGEIYVLFNTGLDPMNMTMFEGKNFLENIYSENNTTLLVFTG